MSSTPNVPESPNDFAHFGDKDSYDTSGVDESTSLTVQLGEQLDSASRKSLESLQRSANSILEYARRNPMRVAIGVAGVAALLAAWSRRASRF